MNRVYVAGCGGMLGQAFHGEFGSDNDLRCTDIDVNDDWLEYLGLRDLDAFTEDVLAFAPDHLCHLSAPTDLEHCETHPDGAMQPTRWPWRIPSTSPMS